MVIKENSIFNEQALLEKIREGSPVLFPTDTLPALGIKPEYSEKLWNIKQRPLKKPLILMGHSIDDLFQDVLPCAIDDALLVAEKYWPGALTIVLPVSGLLVNALNKNERTLGLRIPDLEKARNLLSLTGPLATTSANLSGCKSLQTADEILSVFPKVPLLGPVPWQNASNIASTVIYWQSRGKWKVLRLGAITPEIGWEK